MHPEYHDKSVLRAVSGCVLHAVLVSLFTTTVRTNRSGGWNSGRSESASRTVYRRMGFARSYNDWCLPHSIENRSTLELPTMVYMSKPSTTYLDPPTHVNGGNSFECTKILCILTLTATFLRQELGIRLSLPRST